MSHSLQTPQQNKAKTPPIIWVPCWIIALMLPFFTSWACCHFDRADASMIAIYILSGICLVVASIAVFYSNLRLWAKLVLTLLSVVVITSTSTLGVLADFSIRGFGPGP